MSDTQFSLLARQIFRPSRAQLRVLCHTLTSHIHGDDAWALLRVQWANGCL